LFFFLRNIVAFALAAFLLALFEFFVKTSPDVFYIIELGMQVASRRFVLTCFIVAFVWKGDYI
jgi:hypothetical protein